MFRNLCSELAVSPGEERFLEYFSVPNGRPCWGWVSLEAMRLLLASLAAGVMC